MHYLQLLVLNLTFFLSCGTDPETKPTPPLPAPQPATTVQNPTPIYSTWRLKEVLFPKDIKMDEFPDEFRKSFESFQNTITSIPNDYTFTETTKTLEVTNNGTVEGRFYYDEIQNDKIINIREKQLISGNTVPIDHFTENELIFSNYVHFKCWRAFFPIGIPSPYILDCFPHISFSPDFWTYKERRIPIPNQDVFTFKTKMVLRRLK